jgi:hypothetical protein
MGVLAMEKACLMLVGCVGVSIVHNAHSSLDI